MGKINELEKSLSVLLSLYVMIEQNYDALTYYEDIFSNNSEVFNNLGLPDKKELFVDEAINESLWFQIILKTCSFLEEWDKILGIITETEYKTKIRIIKRVVKPARKAIDNWKGIKSFRNEIIAHNFRNSKGEFKLHEIATYDCPQTNEELLYVVTFLNRMIQVLSFNLPIETQTIVNSMGKIYQESTISSSNDDSKYLKLKEILKRVDEQISIEIFIFQDMI